MRIAILEAVSIKWAGSVIISMITSAMMIPAGSDYRVHASD